MSSRAFRLRRWVKAEPDSIKTKVKDQFTELRKRGLLVFNFNSHLKMPTGIVKMPDYIVNTAWGTYWCEVKLKRDKYTEGQWAVRQQLIENGEMHMTIHDGNYQFLVEFILNKRIPNVTFAPLPKHYQHLTIASKHSSV